MRTLVFEKNRKPMDGFPTSPIHEPIRLETHDHSTIGVVIPLDDYERMRRYHLKRLQRTMDNVAKRANLTEEQVEELLAKDE